MGFAASEAAIPEGGEAENPRMEGVRLPPPRLEEVWVEEEERLAAAALTRFNPDTEGI